MSKKGSRRIDKKSGRNVAFDKYALYRRSVQSPENDVEFIRNVFKELRKKEPRTLREDFCGTAALSCEWVKMRPEHRAVGIDLDPEPIAYGREHYISQLSDEQRKRITLVEENVLTKDLPKADISLGMNFSYFLFKTRPQLLEYFRNVNRNVLAGGLAFFDCFGGSQCQGPIEDKTKHDKFTYFWDQTDFDPITNEALFHIHFRVGGQKIERVFSYDWRMWTIPELRELLAEAGFKRTHVYWEGTAKDGTGNGEFTRTEKGESCLSWIAYIVAEK